MRQYIVDAFTDKVFAGNQAAVCVMDAWPAEELMMSITRENNFSETAFLVGGGNTYELRWFTPGGEIDLCGHATLASAYVVFRFYDASGTVEFKTKSGSLYVEQQGGLLAMDFPAYELNAIEVSDAMEAAFGVRPAKAFIDRDLLCVFESEDVVRTMEPNMEAVEQLPGLGVSVTAAGSGGIDCVSRFFAPKLKVPEDPVTGSAHCIIAPYWAAKLGKNHLEAEQASARGGFLSCDVKGARIVIAGKAALFSECELHV